MIELEVKQRLIAMGKHRGKTMYYASKKKHKRICKTDIVTMIARRTSFSRSEIVELMTCLSDVIHNEIQKGSEIDLGQFGLFRVNIPMTMRERPEEVTIESLKPPLVYFAAKPKLQNAAKAVKLKIENQFM